ncbi:MAG TPA: ATP-binding protein [Terriglobales bacterium]|nr:ATP-binding protein [Terriglobales bacterium]
MASARIAAGFIAWSTIWIVISDYVLHEFIKNTPRVVWTLETAKGLIYVAVAGGLLFAYSRAREAEYFAARQLTENRLLRLTESNLISICYWKSDGEITDANDAFLELLGYSREDLLDRKLNWYDFTPPEFHVRDEQGMKRLTADGRHVIYEKEFIRKDQTRVPVLVGAAILDSSSGRGISYALDMSELKQAQQRSTQLEHQLRQAQKLEAVGLLASGIAHDFNNLLNIILGYTSLIETEVQSNELLSQQAKQVVKAAEKGSSLIRKLLAFGRKQVLKPELLDVNTVLTEYENIVPRLVGEKIGFELHLAPSLWRVEVDRNQLEQVIVNLIVNARDAMPNGGTLSISSANDEASGRVAVTFRDTGIGMDKETMARMFDPFFTTKAEGTGLGLSTVYGIVAQSGGEIIVSSELGKGATFVVYLPKAGQVESVLPPPQPTVPTEPPKQPEPPSADTSAIESSAKRETILLAEDEPNLRELLSSLLRMNGYHVLSANDGREAVEMSQSYGSEIALLLTDITMPHMNGVEAAEEIRSFRPGMKVIFMTGYAEEAFMIAKSSSKDVLLEKPVAPDVLFSKIRELLDSPSNRQVA